MCIPSYFALYTDKERELLQGFFVAAVVERNLKLKTIYLCICTDKELVMIGPLPVPRAYLESFSFHLLLKIKTAYLFYAHSHYCTRFVGLDLHHRSLENVHQKEVGSSRTSWVPSCYWSVEVDS